MPGRWNCCAVLWPHGHGRDNGKVLCENMNKHAYFQSKAANVITQVSSAICQKVKENLQANVYPDYACLFCFLVFRVDPDAMSLLYAMLYYSICSFVTSIKPSVLCHQSAERDTSICHHSMNQSQQTHITATTATTATKSTRAAAPAVNNHDSSRKPLEIACNIMLHLYGLCRGQQC